LGAFRKAYAVINELETGAKNHLKIEKTVDGGWE